MPYNGEEEEWVGPMIPWQGVAGLACQGGGEEEVSGGALVRRGRWWWNARTHREAAFRSLVCNARPIGTLEMIHWRLKATRTLVRVPWRVSRLHASAVASQAVPSILAWGPTAAGGMRVVCKRELSNGWSPLPSTAAPAEA